jgi:hypothetical protein
MKKRLIIEVAHIIMMVAGIPMQARFGRGSWFRKVVWMWKAQMFIRREEIRKLKEGK